jgi:Spy/CpxP family protein refolding chaperone
MSSRLTQVLLGLSLLLNCFVLAGFVYRSWIAPPEVVQTPPPPGSRPSPLEVLSQELKLDDGQRKALQGVFETYANKRRDRYRDIQKIRDQMTAELQKPAFDMIKIDPMIEQMSRLRVDQQKESLRAIAQLEPQLRPEQREQLHKILAERYSGPWPGRPGGPRGPGAPGPSGGRPSQ